MKVLFGGIHSGIKKNGKKDTGIILVKDGATAFGFFTSNQIRSEVIERAEKILKRRNYVKAVVVISGNAMCRYVGVEKDAKRIAREFSSELKKIGVRAREDEILLLATGKIGVPLESDKVVQKIPNLLSSLSESEEDFAEAILTTDKKKKVVKYSKNGVNIAGIAKGAGMIFPKFSEATTLSFIISDTFPPKNRKKIYEILSDTIGSVNIDSSTSTNDTSLFIFTCEKKAKDDEILDGLNYVLSHLAVKIAEDGEGVDHVVKVRVFGATSEHSARRICEAISQSPLFKSSIAGENPDVGRILSAIGSTKEKLGKISIWFSDDFEFKSYSSEEDEEGEKDAGVVQKSEKRKEKVLVVKNTKIIYENLEKAKEIMKRKKYTILVDVGSGGKGVSEILMTDLTVEYVKINLT